MEQAIEKLNNIIKAVGMLDEADVELLVQAQERIESTAQGKPNEQDRAGLTRIASILAIYSTLEKEQ